MSQERVKFCNPGIDFFCLLWPRRVVAYQWLWDGYCDNMVQGNRVIWSTVLKRMTKARSSHSIVKRIIACQFQWKTWEWKVPFERAVVLQVGSGLWMGLTWGNYSLYQSHQESMTLANLLDKPYNPCYTFVKGWLWLNITGADNGKSPPQWLGPPEDADIRVFLQVRIHRGTERVIPWLSQSHRTRGTLQLYKF